MIWAVLIFAIVAMLVGAWFGRKPLAEHPIRAFALLLVAAITAYFMWTAYISDAILSGPDWCRAAIGADKADKDSKLDVAASCVGLLTIQLKAVAAGSKIKTIALGVSELVLVVIVLAGGRLAGKLPGGAEIDISNGNAVAAAADKVATSAVVAASEVKAETAGAAPVPHPEYTGPAMPPPPPKQGS